MQFDETVEVLGEIMAGVDPGTLQRAGRGPTDPDPVELRTVVVDRWLVTGIIQPDFDQTLTRNPAELLATFP